jgi:AcrR family transcriptional regulator
VEESKHPQSRRSKVPRDEASSRLIDATIDLMKKIPFAELSVRKITQHADLNPSTVLRIFGTSLNLYNEVCTELLRRSVEKFGSELDPAALIDEDVVLRTKLQAWLLANGIETERISVSTDEVPVRALVENIANRAGVNERTAVAFNEILAFGAEGFIVFNEIHTQDQQVRLDALALIEQFEQLLPVLEERLGWK